MKDLMKFEISILGSTNAMIRLPLVNRSELDDIYRFVHSKPKLEEINIFIFTFQWKEDELIGRV